MEFPTLLIHSTLEVRTYWCKEFYNFLTTILTLEYIALDPEQGKYFQTRKPGEPYLTCNATIPGRILLKVWSMGIQSIDPKVLEIASRAAHVRHSFYKA